MEFDTLSDISYDDISRHKKKTYKRKYFPTLGQNGYICNAATGVLYPFKIGSFESQRLYKVVDATGTCSSEGFPITNRLQLPNPNPNHLYYANPEEYMRHWQTNLAPDLVRKWHANVLKRFPKNYELEEEEENEMYESFKERMDMARA